MAFEMPKSHAVPSLQPLEPKLDSVMNEAGCDSPFIASRTMNQMTQPESERYSEILTVWGTWFGAKYTGSTGNDGQITGGLGRSGLEGLLTCDESGRNVDQPDLIGLRIECGMEEADYSRRTYGGERDAGGGDDPPCQERHPASDIRCKSSGLFWSEDVNEVVLPAR
jgi:hypothetical protein